MMRFLVRLPLLLLLLLVLHVVVVDGFPGGVGGCAPDRAAVEGSHLGSLARQTGPIGGVRLQLVLDDEHVFRGATTMDFTVGQDHTLTLRKMDDAAKSFRGFLFRLGPPPDEPDIDTTDALTRTTSNTTVAFDQCIMGEGVGGLGHTNALLKESVSGILRMERVARGMPLDVTVVIQNYGGLSEYYYQQFIINAVQGDTGLGGPVPPPRIPTFPPILTGGGIPPAVAPILPPNVAPILAPTTTLQQPPEEEPTVSEEAPPIPQPVHQQKASPDAKCGSLAAAGDRGGSAAQAKDCSRHSADGGGGFRRRKLKGSTN